MNPPSCLLYYVIISVKSPRVNNNVHKNQHGFIESVLVLVLGLDGDDRLSRCYAIVVVTRGKW